MLAELAAANAAFAVIKKCVENGSEIAKAGQAIADFTLNKDAVQKKAAAQPTKLSAQQFTDLNTLVKDEDEDFRDRVVANVQANKIHQGNYKIWTDKYKEAKKNKPKSKEAK